MTRFAHYQKYSTWYEYGVVALFLIANAVVLASSRISDALRMGELPFHRWEPFVWELSSVLMIILLLPAVRRLFYSRLTNWAKAKSTLLIYLGASVVFSIAHVTGMVAIREAVYLMSGMDYDFGNIVFEFLYEYRKDLLTFILVVALMAMYQALLSRLQGEANLVGDGEDGDLSSDRLLVRKLGKEFIVRINDIEWLEASGNYVNLHIGNRIYPIRSTLNKLMEQLNEKGFCRTHRSYGVSLDAVESICPNPSGNSEITLKTGKTLILSRRYREKLKQRIG